MRRRHRFLAAASLLAPAACSQPAPTAHRGRESSTTVVDTAGTDAASPAGVGPANLSPSTTEATTTTAVTIVLPTDPPTTTTVRPRPLPTTTLPERVDEPDEFDARDAATARVSWYGDESGSHTANGDRYDPSGLTFAHLSMPFGTRVRFCGPLGCVVATCTDRGPAAWTGKTFDLSQGAFALVAPLSAGVATVTWERVG